MRESCAFVPIKPTALASPRILERLTEGERAVRAARGTTARGATARSASAAAEWERCEPPSLEESSAAAQLSAEEEGELERSMLGLRALCDGARAAALPLLLDAEQTHRQPAIGLLARTPSRQCN